MFGVTSYLQKLAEVRYELNVNLKLLSADRNLKPASYVTLKIKSVNISCCNQGLEILNQSIE
jgi:hypothetical protein